MIEQQNNIVISVIMSVYKEPIDWLKMSIESILNQTYGNFEFIIINDNPDDLILFNFLQSMQSKDDRIVLINNKYNLGLTKSLNLGLKISKGKYIARMDADDVSSPSRFEKQLYILDNDDKVDVVFGHVLLFTDDLSNNKLRKIHLHNDTIQMILLRRNCLVHPVAMMRKSFLNDNNISYDIHFKRSQDYDLWLTMILLGVNFYIIDEPLLYYRKSEIQISTKNRGEQNDYALLARIKFFNHYFMSVGVTYDGTLNPKFLNEISKNIKVNRPWLPLDTNIFAMLYYNMSFSFGKLLSLVTEGLFLYKLSCRQVFHILRPSKNKDSVYELKDVLHGILVNK